MKTYSNQIFNANDSTVNENIHRNILKSAEKKNIQPGRNINILVLNIVGSKLQAYATSVVRDLMVVWVGRSKRLARRILMMCNYFVGYFLSL